MKKTINDLVKLLKEKSKIIILNKKTKDVDYKQLISEYNIESKSIIYKRTSLQIKADECLMEIKEEGDNYKTTRLESYVPLLDFNIIEEKEEGFIYQEVQKIHHTSDDFIDGDLGDRIEEFKYYHLQVIDLMTLNKDEWIVFDDAVDDIVDEIKTKGLQDMPKMIISDKKSLIDGIHRLNALLKIGITNYPCYVGSNLNIEQMKKQEFIKPKKKNKLPKQKR